MVWLAALAAHQTAAAEEAEAVLVRGRVVEAGSERPIAGARLAAGDQEATSDAQGRFQLLLRPGTWTLAVESAQHLRELGLAPDRIASLIDRGIVAASPPDEAMHGTSTGRVRPDPDMGE